MRTLARKTRSWLKGMVGIDPRDEEIRRMEVQLQERIRKSRQERLTRRLTEAGGTNAVLR